MAKRKKTAEVTVRYADGRERVAKPGEFQKRGKRAKYKRYLRSPEWKTKRRAVVERDGGRCKVCRGDETLEVHHLTYVRFGRERLEDLALLCQRCHSAEHQWDKFHRARSGSTVTLAERWRYG